MATFYVEVDTYYQNAESFFVGPFATRAGCAAWCEGRDDTLTLWPNEAPANIFHAHRIIRACISATAARARGMRGWDDTDAPDAVNVLPPDTRATADGIREAIIGIGD